MYPHSHLHKHSPEPYGGWVWVGWLTAVTTTALWRNVSHACLPQQHPSGSNWLLSVPTGPRVVRIALLLIKRYADLAQQHPVILCKVIVQWQYESLVSKPFPSLWNELCAISFWLCIVSLPSRDLTVIKKSWGYEMRDLRISEVLVHYFQFLCSWKRITKGLWNLCHVARRANFQAQQRRAQRTHCPSTQGTLCVAGEGRGRRLKIAFVEEVGRKQCLESLRSSFFQ